MYMYVYIYIFSYIYIYIYIYTPIYHAYNLSIITNTVTIVPRENVTNERNNF